MAAGTSDLGKVVGKGGKDARRSFKEENAGFGGVDVAEVAAHIELGDIADGAGQFHPCWPAADDHEVERRVPAVLDHLALGQLKREQHAAADLKGVFDGLEAGSKGRPLI